jgi:restriction endonuclease S subunit
MSTKAAKDGGVPRLRFPEFLEAGEWESKLLANVCNVLQGYGFPEALQGKREGEYPFCKVSDISRAVAETGGLLAGAANYVDDDELLILRAKPIPKGATVFAKIGEALRLNRRAFVEKECLIDNNATGLKAIDGVADDYFVYLLSQQIDLNNHCGGAVPSVNKSTLEEIEVVVPRPDEQQKIANCLASLDELITLETQKLDTLKTHKKGLMQQLFPAEGETLPRLRFPEFEDAGEWEEKSIQELIDSNIIIGHLDGNHGELYPRSDEFSEVGVPYISANDFANGSVDFSKCKHLPEQRAKLFKKGVAKNGDILFAHNATVGPVAKLKTNFDFVILSTTATYFRCDNHRLINDYLQFTLSSPLFVGQYTRVMKQSTRNQVPITTQRMFKLVLPKRAEQQKIADCLASLDELITLETQKLAALKTHKKGLMQQLFPALD